MGSAPAEERVGELDYDSLAKPGVSGCSTYSSPAPTFQPPAPPPQLLLSHLLRLSEPEPGFSTPHFPTKELAGKAG